MNIARLLERSAAACPDHPAVIRGNDILTFAALEDRVARLASYLASRGLRPGDRIAIVQWNGPAVLVSLLAAFRGGFCAVPINARSTPYEVTQILEDAEVAAVVYGPEYLEHVAIVADGCVRICVGGEGGADGEINLDDALNAAGRPAAAHPARSDDIAWLFYTSGTTGRMKGATLTHRNLLAMVAAYLADIRALPSNAAVLHAAPLSHGSGLYALPPLARAATQVLTSSRSYDPEEVLRLVRERRITDIAFLAPTMVKWLLDANDAKPLPTLEHVVYGGAPMYVDDLKRALAEFGPIFTQIYGQAEAPVTIARLTREDHIEAQRSFPERLMSTGRPYTTVDVGIVDDKGNIVTVGEGEIVVRGDVVMRGYWRNDEATTHVFTEGWLHTGDLGRMDEAGFVFLLDRNKDMIISGGANIYPREVEEVILEHPLVKQVAVVGAPDDEWGEHVVAVIAPVDGSDPTALRIEVVQLCRDRLAGYKQPRRFEWMEQLPTSAYGKILKRELRERMWAGRERRI